MTCQLRRATELSVPSCTMEINQIRGVVALSYSLTQEADMRTVMVNARVDAEDKRVADQVLAASQRTWSQAIQALSSYMARTRQFPEVLSAQAEDAERQRRLEILLSMSGMVKTDRVLTDEDIANILHEEIMRRHG